MKNQKNIEKLKELILFLTENNKENPRFGSTVLNKMLYYTDFYWFAYTGQSMTGEDYVRQEYGPVPRSLLKAREELEKEGTLKIEEVTFYGKPQKRPINKVPFKQSKLNNNEIEFAKMVIKHFEVFTATQISDVSHKLPWEVANNDDVIPYETIYWQEKNTIPDSTINWAQTILIEKKTQLKYD